MAADDVELIREALRAVLRAEGTSGKHMEAKANAARQLAKLDGLVKDEQEPGDSELAPDPMADLDDEFSAYRARRRRRAA